MIFLAIAFAIYTPAVYYFSASGGEKALSGKEVAGWQLWQDKNCQSCHQLYGLGGYLGPDLTNVMSGKGSDYMRGIIQYGTGRMPNLNLSAGEVEDIIAFLSWVNKSGQSKVPDSAVHWTGSYSISQR